MDVIEALTRAARETPSAMRFPVRTMDGAKDGADDSANGAAAAAACRAHACLAPRHAARWILETSDVRLSWRPLRASYGALRLQGVSDGVASVCQTPRLEVALAWIDLHLPGELSRTDWQVRIVPTIPMP